MSAGGSHSPSGRGDDADVTVTAAEELATWAASLDGEATPSDVERDATVAKLWFPDRLAGKLTAKEAVNFPVSGAFDLLATEANIRWRTGDYRDDPERVFDSLSPAAALVHSSAEVAAEAGRDRDDAVGVIEQMYDETTSSPDAVDDLFDRTVAAAKTAVNEADGSPDERVTAGRRVFLDARDEFHREVVVAIDEANRARAEAGTDTEGDE